MSYSGGRGKIIVIVVPQILRTGVQRRLTFHSVLLSGLECSLCPRVYWGNVIYKEESGGLP